MGRHSKPKVKRKNTAVAITTTTVLSGMALTSGVAQAHTNTPNWDPIIQCESGNRNVENGGTPGGVSTASGYFQFVNGTWNAFGGREFAPRAIQATKAEQTIVANRAFARNGLRDWNASRSCWGRQLGIINAGNPIARPTPAPTPAPRQLPRTRNTLQCADFPNVAAANAELAKDLSDPHLIDTNNNNIPCEARFGLRGRVAVTNVGSSVPTNSVVALARDLADNGIPYVYGGKTLRGFDCSGFVSYVLNQTNQMTGYRNSSALRGWAIPISARDARPGDLTFVPGHVAIYLGNGMIADAGNTRTDVTVRRMWNDPNRTFGRPRGA